MSDTFDHEWDAIEQMLEHPELEIEASMGMPRRRLKYQPTQHYLAEEDAQPEFQTLEVSKLHKETERAYCVSGVVQFETPYRGIQTFEFKADWIPKSRCIVTGNMARIPHWIIRCKLRDRLQRARQFPNY